VPAPVNEFAVIVELATNALELTVPFVLLIVKDPKSALILK